MGGFSSISGLLSKSANWYSGSNSILRLVSRASISSSSSGSGKTVLLISSNASVKSFIISGPSALASFSPSASSPTKMTSSSSSSSPSISSSKSSLRPLPLPLAPGPLLRPRPRPRPPPTSLPLPPSPCSSSPRDNIPTAFFTASLRLILGFLTSELPSPGSNFSRPLPAPGAMATGAWRGLRCRFSSLGPSLGKSLLAGIPLPDPVNTFKILSGRCFSPMG
uniref:Uncharacterized protein n=1 Tax=Opuntia streptacantha TaxID=393608 RepID=A0A7C9A6H0_OPUST